MAVTLTRQTAGLGWAGGIWVRKGKGKRGEKQDFV